ncbi:MAG: hypothetical protein JO266_13610 [Acidobacteria bacterium]|nr:hypothetical protein [Acidobacteriota bacterium]
MIMMRLCCVLVLTAVTAVGCTIGAPERASNIQNLNAIPDDIWSIWMTRPPTQKVQDPNRPTTIPNNYELPPD